MTTFFHGLGHREALVASGEMRANSGRVSRDAPIDTIVLNKHTGVNDRYHRLERTGPEELTGICCAQ